MFVLNTNFADPNNPTGYPSRKSVTKSGGTCFETVDDLGGADGLAGNSLEARSQDSVTNFGMVEDEIKFQCDDGDLACYETTPWHEWYEEVNLNGFYREVEVPALEEPSCQCGNDLSPECNPSRENPFNPSRTFDSETELANVV